MKGISFNVTLSNEQMEEIANLSADKVLNSMSKKMSNEEWYKYEIENLKKQLTNRDRMIVEREIIIERWKVTCDRYKDKIDQYKEKFGEI